MRILAIISGEYGVRHVENIRTHAPETWNLQIWNSPNSFPLIIDYPEDYLPVDLPAVDLILSFAENKGVAELLPDMARMTGAQAVIAPVDNEAWLPRGLARQLRGWLERMDVDCATPKPLCSLTDHDYGVTRRQRISYDNSFIREFATYFGQPEFDISVDPDTRLITEISVKRDAVCGCARYVAEHLIGVLVDNAPEKAGLLHHHYPCLASMGKDIDFGDTLMHVSGNVLKDKIRSELRPYIKEQYISPDTKSD